MKKDKFGIPSKPKSYVPELEGFIKKASKKEYGCKIIKTTFDMPQDLRLRLKRAAVDSGHSMRDIIVEALEAHLNK